MFKKMWKLSQEVYSSKWKYKNPNKNAEFPNFIAYIISQIINKPIDQKANLQNNYDIQEYPVEYRSSQWFFSYLFKTIYKFLVKLKCYKKISNIDICLQSWEAYYWIIEPKILYIWKCQSLKNKPLHKGLAKEALFQSYKSKESIIIWLVEQINSWLLRGFFSRNKQILVKKEKIS